MSFLLMFSLLSYEDNIVSTMDTGDTLIFTVTNIETSPIEAYVWTWVVPLDSPGFNDVSFDFDFRTIIWE